VLYNFFCFWIVEFLGLAAPEWFFSSQSFHFVNKYLSFYFLHLKIFLLHTNTHTLGSFRSQYLFSIGIGAGKLVFGFIS
jgi:hypothetical protein